MCVKLHHCNNDIFASCIDKNCKPDEFYCPSGVCILSNLTCNGVLNCPDGADEPAVCGTVKVGKQTTMCMHIPEMRTFVT